MHIHKSKSKKKDALKGRKMREIAFFGARSHLPECFDPDSRSNFGTEFSHFRPPLPNQSLFSSQNKMATLPL